MNTGPSTTRRVFLKTSLIATGGFWMASRTGADEGRSPNDKLDIGIIGVNNRARSNIAGVKGENIVALCDIDDKFLAQAAKEFPQAKTYNDFRKLIDENRLDAVVVSTPDHIHVPASVHAMKSGMDVYCEKPLSHSVHEARVSAQIAREHKRVTQLGTQIHAGANYRRCVELIQSGAIGPVREAHAWVGKTWGGGDRPADTPAVPKHLHFDLWLGPAAERPYHPTYLPQNWRRWWDFGGGTLGDMGCHYLDLVFWALKLRHPTAVEAEGPPAHPETAPNGSAAHWDFPSRGDMPAARLSWWDGGRRPPHFARGEMPSWGDGVLFVGDRGKLLCSYGDYRLLPEKEFTDFQPPEAWIPNSIGHYKEWIQACKTRGETTCNFDYSGALTETVLLGNVAFRTGHRLEWDANNLRITNCSQAQTLIRREYREGWTL